MRASKSFNSLAGLHNNQSNNTDQPRDTQHNSSTPTSPICRCRVMYLGSSVPHITKDGLQGIQEPLKELYPDRAGLDQGNVGIDSWLSVWSNGILIENVDETGREVKRFFKIEALHYCAAVKFVPQIVYGIAEQSSSSATMPNFLPLDSPQARMQQPGGSFNPPIFASILRRTTGVKVLECHAFICKREAAANALVRCCFHAYADTMYAKQIGADIDLTANVNDIHQAQSNISVTPTIAARRSKSIANLNQVANDDESDSRQYSNQIVSDRGQSQCARRKSPTIRDPCDNSNQTIYAHNDNLQSMQQNLSKSMYQLNRPDGALNRSCDLVDSSLISNQSTSQYNLSRTKTKQDLAVPIEPIHNQYTSRVPSYPPQSIIDQQQTSNMGGTLRSVKSMAANSIASTLLRSKKHAKAMSMAQLNQNLQPANPIVNENITSFHQPYMMHNQQAATMGGPGSFMTLPPVPPMFMQNMTRLPIINGSQTLKLPNRNNQHHLLEPGPIGPVLPQFNFDTMTSKEMKKLLKKSAKYGIDPSKFTENGLPILPPHLLSVPPIPMQIARPAPPTLLSAGKSGTLGSRSLYSVDGRLVGPPQDIQDYASQTLPYGAAGLGLGPLPPPPPPPEFQQALGGTMQPIKSILVKPNPEFLKSKAGKKWLKQQKEFKKLLPPHLDGLPIVFGPPPPDALEPAMGLPPNGTSSMPPPPPAFIHPPVTIPSPPINTVAPNGCVVPIMDSSGYYNPHPFYGPSGRASAASTLLRHSPHSQMIQQQQQHLYGDGHNSSNNHPHEHSNPMQRSHPQSMYSEPSMQSMGRAQDPGAIFYGQSGTFEPQYSIQNDAMFSHRGRSERKSHMVEQKVISLGDELEGDGDSVHEDIQMRNIRGRDKSENGHLHREDEDSQTDGYYDQVHPAPSSSSVGHQNGAHNKPRRGHHGHQMGQLQNRDRQQKVTAGTIDSDHSEANQQHSDEQSGYSSSGIYRRKHLNERAFSYSIRQEHRSNGGSNSDADFSDSGYRQQQTYHQDLNNNGDSNYQQQYAQQPVTYDNPQQLYQNRSQILYASRNQHQPMDELTTKFENKLKVKSFPNSSVKSHM